MKPYLKRPRSKAQLKAIAREILEEWSIDGYYVMTQPTGSTIYPDKHIIAVGSDQVNWPKPAVVSSILHEIGHIEMGHYLGEYEDCLPNHVDEYEADEFAWDAVRTRYGYYPKAAGLWMLQSYGQPLWVLDTWTHPSYEHRWERLALNGLVPADYLSEILALRREKGDK